MVLESRKRREHLTPEDLRKNKALMETLTKGSGSSSSLADSNGDPIRRNSLSPPPKVNISWEEYIDSSQQPHLGRVIQCKDISKTFKATVAMVSDSFSCDYPLCDYIV